MKKGDGVEYVIPSATILIQNPVAVLKASNTAARRRSSHYLVSTAGQTIWVDKGYRPGRSRASAGGLEVPDPARAVHDRIPRRLERR